MTDPNELEMVDRLRSYGVRVGPPSLTVMRQKLERMGRRAADAERLEDAIETIGTLLRPTAGPAEALARRGVIPEARNNILELAVQLHHERAAGERTLDTPQGDSAARAVDAVLGELAYRYAAPLHFAVLQRHDDTFVRFGRSRDRVALLERWRAEVADLESGWPASQITVVRFFTINELDQIVEEGSTR